MIASVTSASVDVSNSEGTQFESACSHTDQFPC